MEKQKKTSKKILKKTSKKKTISKKPTKKNFSKIVDKKSSSKDYPSLDLKTDFEIASDFATKLYQRFDKIIKSVVLFGSTAKKKAVAGSDLDIIIIIDDVSIKWDQQLVVWYREELEKLLKKNPYQIDLHINTIKLSTWWQDLIRGDPVVLNVIRDGRALIDFGGFFEPLKYLLYEGKIRSTPEAIYSLLQRAPAHITRSKISELNSIEGLYWAMVDSAQAALISAHIDPASPEHIPIDLKENFVDNGRLKMKYVVWYRDLLYLHKKIIHGQIIDIKGEEIDDWQKKTEEFFQEMIKIVKSLV